MIPDRGEAPASMEPLLITEGSRHRGRLTELAFELGLRASAFRSSIPPAVRSALAELVRSMNCYYSNLIEGHDTHPIDIERALRKDYSRDPRQRDLQREARAHVEVQRWIDAGGLAGRATTVESLREIHRRFCEQLPEDLLWAEDPETGRRLRVEPGALRTRDVRVGAHVPPSPGALPRLLAHFERTFGSLGKADAIVAAAAAHHRLLWLHPFLDGNGRVARLASHATLLEALDTGGVWSIARALARSVVAYKDHLAACDLPRRNDLDGRGALSEEELARFTIFFLDGCLDQVTFMQSLVEPGRLRARVLLWAEEEARLGHLPLRAGGLLEALLYRGELPRGDTASATGSTDRHARRIVASLLEAGVVTSDGPRAPLRLAFPAALASRWMPGLFPERSRPPSA
jgi:Fic family protein